MAKSFVLYVLLLIAGCGSASTTFGVAQPATGLISLTSPSSGGSRISGFVFENEGTQSVFIAEIQVTLTNGQPIGATGAGFGLTPNDPITYDINVQNHVSEPADVASLSFNVMGSTEKLVVETTNEAINVP
jgi:hypothetical protein